MGGWKGAGGGDKNPPTARATRTKGADGSKGRLMGGQRMEDPPGTADTAEDDCSMGPQPRQSDSADGARSKHGAFARRKYGLLASEATEGVPSNAGAAGSKDGHGDLANQEGAETEE